MSKAPSSTIKASKQVDTKPPSTTVKRTYAKTLAAKAKGQKPEKTARHTKAVAQAKRALSSNSPARKTSTGALAAGLDDPKYTPITPSTITAFLAVLATHGRMTHACQELRLHYPSIKALQKEDADFKAAFDEAMEQAVNGWEDSANKRAFTGWKRPVYQQGLKVGETIEYSDPLAMMILRAQKPERYNPRTTTMLEHSGTFGMLVGQMTEDELNDAINKKLKFIGALPAVEDKELEEGPEVVDVTELNKSAGDFSD